MLARSGHTGSMVSPARLAIEPAPGSYVFDR